MGKGGEGGGGGEIEAPSPSGGKEVREERGGLEG